jgi:hypothetical protein
MGYCRLIKAACSRLGNTTVDRHSQTHHSFIIYKESSRLIISPGSHTRQGNTLGSLKLLLYSSTDSTPGFSEPHIQCHGITLKVSQGELRVHGGALFYVSEHSGTQLIVSVSISEHSRHAESFTSFQRTLKDTLNGFLA